MRGARWPLSAVAVVGLLVCALPQGSAQTLGFVFDGTSDQEAAAGLADYIAARGLTAIEQPDGVLRLEQGLTWLCQPRMSKDGLDRIVCYLFFRVADDRRGSQDLRMYANELSQKYNFGGFYVDRNGDLAFQTQLTFVNRIEGAEFDAFYQYLGGIVELLIDHEQARLQAFLG